MSAYKKLNKQDVYVTAYTARKNWEASGSVLNDYGVEVTRGFDSPEDYYINDWNFRNNRYEDLTFRSIKQLYYSNEFTESLDQSASYDNFHQSSYTVDVRNLGTEVGVISIPREVAGTHLEPNTVELDVLSEDIDNYVWYDETEDLASYGQFNSPGEMFTVEFLNGEQDYVESIHDIFGGDQIIDCTDFIVSESDYLDETDSQYVDIRYNQRTSALKDDGEGNLIYSGSEGVFCADQSKVGNVIYSHGQLVVTDETIARYYSTYLRPIVRWKSNQPIYTYNVHCKVKDSEMNFSYNPTAISGSNGDIASNLKVEEFEPYMTTVGLYNDANELIAVAKLGQPIPKSSKTDMTIVVKIDL